MPQGILVQLDLLSAVVDDLELVRLGTSWQGADSLVSVGLDSLSGGCFDILLVDVAGVAGGFVDGWQLYLIAAELCTLLLSQL